MLTSLAYIVGPMLLLAGVAVGVAVRDTGGLVAGFRYLRESGVYKDWLRAAAIVFVVSAVITAVKADEPDTFEYTEVFFGLDYQADSGVCEPGGLGDSVLANFGVRQQIIGYDLPVGRIDLVASYTHHSCAVNADAAVYDGAGVIFVYRIEWGD